MIYILIMICRTPFITVYQMRSLLKFMTIILTIQVFYCCLTFMVFSQRTLIVYSNIFYGWLFNVYGIFPKNSHRIFGCFGILHLVVWVPKVLSGRANPTDFYPRFLFFPKQPGLELHVWMLTFDKNPRDYNPKVAHSWVKKERLRHLF